MPHGISNNWQLDCLLQSMFRLTKKTSDLHVAGPLWRESTGDRWIPLTKGQWSRNCFNLMSIKVPYYWSFMKGTHQWQVDFPHKVPVMWKAFPYHNIILSTAKGIWRLYLQILVYLVTGISWYLYIQLWYQFSKQNLLKSNKYNTCILTFWLKIL